MRRGRERGVALILVLGTIVVVSTAALALARSVTLSRSAAAFERDEAIHDDLMRSADAWIRRWLERDAPLVVLEPSATSPRVDIGRVSGHLAGRAFTLRAMAFDQDGMAPPENASGASKAAWEKVQARVAGTLDGFDQVDPRLMPRGVSVFPSFSAAATPALAESIALPPPRRPRIHVHTAPIARLTEVYRALGISGIEQVIDARAQGRRLAVAPSLDATRSFERVPIPVIESTSWAVRLEIEAGSILRNWWCVYRSEGKSGFRCVQRLVIDA